MQISEVSEILGLCHFLKVPKHIFITQEKVSSKEEGSRETFYRGLQPKSKGDSIFLTGQADCTTPVHEAVHAMTGFDEVGTEIVTKAILRKNQILNLFPNIRSLRNKPPVYKKVESDPEYPEAHMEKFNGRVEHYVLIE